MGLDGFSMANLGLHRDATSSQMALESDQIAKVGAGRKIQDVDSMAKDEGVRRRDGDYHDGGYGAGGSESDEDEAGVNASVDDIADDLQSNSLTREEFENAPERFQMRINPETQMLELYDKFYSRVLERISTEDLIAMIANLNSVSGMLVNKKV